jgi:hypothetical protein
MAGVVSAGFPTEPLEGAVTPTANAGSADSSTTPASGVLASTPDPRSGFPTASLGGLLILIGLGFFLVWIRRRRGRTEA